MDFAVRNQLAVRVSDRARNLNRLRLGESRFCGPDASGHQEQATESTAHYSTTSKRIDWFRSPSPPFSGRLTRPIATKRLAAPAAGTENCSGADRESIW